MRRHLRIKIPGSSMQRQGTYVFFFLVGQRYVYNSFTCISSYTYLITPATKYKTVFWYSGKISFIELQGINEHRRPVPGAPSNGTSRESKATFRDGTVWVL